MRTISPRKLARRFVKRYAYSSIGRNQEESMEEKTCKGDHKGHLCVLASNEKFDLIKGLTKNPKHICFNCGRVADSAENLCNPMPLD